MAQNHQNPTEKTINTWEGHVLFRRVQRLQRFVWICVILWIITLSGVLFLYTSGKNDLFQNATDDVLKTRGLIIVDENGTTRLQIGAPLPDPPILGKRVNRGGTAHGILLFDSEGNERGSFVTFDESGTVMMSLDETARMVAQFLAYPAGGARLRVRDQYGNIVLLGTLEEGPFIKMESENRELLLEPNIQKEKNP